MCLGIPGKITDIYQKDSLRMARIDFGGIIKEACLEYTPEAKVGDYALIHVGFAISLMAWQELTSAGSSRKPALNIRPRPMWEIMR